MARVDADRNLLLGIPAQQMDFISRDALFAATSNNTHRIGLISSKLPQGSA
jgi:hypothetical protein